MSGRILVSHVESLVPIPSKCNLCCLESALADKESVKLLGGKDLAWTYAESDTQSMMTGCFHPRSPETHDSALSTRHMYGFPGNQLK